GAQLSKFGPAGQRLLHDIGHGDGQRYHLISSQLANPDEPQLGMPAAGVRNTAQQLASRLRATINTHDTKTHERRHRLVGTGPVPALDGDAGHARSIQNNQGNFQEQQSSLRSQLQCAQNLDATLTSLLNGTPAPGAAAPVAQPLSIPGLTQSPALCQQV